MRAASSPSSPRDLHALLDHPLVPQLELALRASEGLHRPLVLLLAQPVRWPRPKRAVSVPKAVPRAVAPDPRARPVPRLTFDRVARTLPQFTQEVVRGFEPHRREPPTQPLLNQMLGDRALGASTVLGRR